MKSELNETKQTISQLKVTFEFVQDPEFDHGLFYQLHRDRSKRSQKWGFNDQSGSHKTIRW